MLSDNKRAYRLLDFTVQWRSSKGWFFTRTARFDDKKEWHGCNSSSAIADSNWHYVAATYDGTTVHFYIDGDSAGSCTLSHTPNTVLGGTSYIGRLDVGPDYFAGNIDLVKVSSGAKSAGAISAYYQDVLATAPPVAPTNLSGSATTTSAIGLLWTDASSYETGFNVERSTDGANWTPIASTSANVTSYYDDNSSANTTYYYRVRAFNNIGYSAYSNVVTVGEVTLAFWNMNGTAGSSGKQSDDGPSGLSLTEYGGPMSVTGTTSPQTDGAYGLDGSTQYLTAGDSGFATGNGARTVEAWVQRSSASHENTVFMYGDRSASYQLWKLSILSSGGGNKLRIDINGAGCNSSSAIADSDWHYLAATYDGTTVRFHIDGDSAGSCTLSQTPSTVLAGTSYIGRLDVAPDYFAGNIDLVKFSSGAKSATAIYNYYHGL